jgi:Fic family protein
MQRMGFYIHENEQWPNFYWNIELFINQLSEARNLQGRLMGKMESYGFELKNEALLDNLILDVVKSTEIEGEFLNPTQVRSSIATKLGMENAGIVASNRNVEGMVEMMLDATQNCFEPLTKERLFDWHASLFPTGRSGISKIIVADWRKDIKGPMYVISGSIGKEKIHFEAPKAVLIEAEMQQFLTWLNAENEIDLVIKAAVAHLWFLTIHPFQDGNGRISRAISDMILAQSDNSTQRFYSMSAQIMLERKQYYDNLEQAQKGDLDITTWIKWYLNCLINALKSTETNLMKVLSKAEFWNKHAKTIISERQKKLINKLLCDFEGNLTSSKWAKIAQCSKDSAIRDINDLITKEILQKAEAGGRSTNYELRISH